MDHISLDGLWRFQPDVHDDGEALGYWKADYDPRFWREAVVPSCFDTCLPELERYLGVCWYRSINLPDIEIVRGRRYLLRFEAVNNRATVWVGGQRVGENVDPFLPFEFDITEFIAGGVESIVVKADNRHHAGDVPGMHTGWHQAGGIIRGVELRVVPELRIDQIAVTADHYGKVAATVRIEGKPPGDVRWDVSAEVLDSDANPTDGSLSAESPAGDHVVFGGGFTGVEPWSPETPALYTLNVTLSVSGNVVDTRAIRFGFRSVETRGTELLLNGKPVYLTGFNRHDDSPTTGMAYDPAWTLRDLKEMKAAGSNTVRLCHYPHAASELDLCDELGLLAFCEIPLYFWNDKIEGLATNEGRLQAARRQLETMIERDRNHPSVIIWSVSNETDEEHEVVAEANRELIRYARHLDPSRLCVHVSNHWKDYPNFAEDDLICINSYPSIDWQRRGQLSEVTTAGAMWQRDLDAIAQNQPGKPVLITEFGFCSLPGTNGHAFGENNHAKVLEAEFPAIAAHPAVCGSLVWCWADHPWPAGRFFDGMLVSPFGVLSRSRRKQAPYHAIAGLFREKQGIKTPPPADWPSGTGVVLERPTLSNIPEVPLPHGYELRPMSPGESGLWTDIQRDAEPYFPVTDTLFHEQFGDDPAAVGWRCFILRNENGLGIGTISAWYSRDFRGEEWGRIHWVALRPSHQGRGLSKGMLSRALKTLARWHDKAYLDTDTRRVAAIALYLKFGFVPDLTPSNARKVWTDFFAVYGHPAIREALEHSP